MHPSKTPASSVGLKTKKQFKEKEKRKPQNFTNQSESAPNDKEKGSPSKDFQDYAGISSDSICIYAEQSSYEHLTEEVCNILTEDINYKLRYIIHNSLIKAKLQGRDAISSGDIEEMFTNLKIDKVFGAASSPNWLPFGDQSLFYLDDQKVNLPQLAEKESTYIQEGDIILEKNWILDLNSLEAEHREAFDEYFKSMCQALVSSDSDLRNAALLDISENPSIGPITEWFYHFAYFLLMKDITYDCLTLRALQLLEILENSPLPSVNVSIKQLKLLVRLLLQRLLISRTTNDILKAMCSVLATLCLRQPLKEMAIVKINQKFSSVCQQMALPLLNIIYFLGIDAVKQIFLPNMNYFLARIKEEGEHSELMEITLAIYGLMCKADVNNSVVFSSFNEIFGNILVPYWLPKKSKIVKGAENMDIDFVNMKKQLIKTRRKVDCRIKKCRTKFLEEIFEIPPHNCIVKKKLDLHRSLLLGLGNKKETHVTVGKTSILLAVLNYNKNTRPTNCQDHSLLAFNL